MHYVKTWHVATLVARRDRYGNRLPSPGTVHSECKCGWSMVLDYTGSDRDQVCATLAVAVKGHIEGAAVQDTPNAGHPFFQKIEPVPVRYRKKEPEYTAVRWDGTNQEVFTRAGYWIMPRTASERSVFVGKAGYPVMVLEAGDWLVASPDGQLAVFEDEKFKESFEETSQRPRAFEFPVC